MKKMLLILIAATLSHFVQAQTADIEKVIQFKNAEFDFGKIPYGKPVKYTLEVTNISQDTIVLENVQVGCGCTTPEFEKGKKIPKGETYKIGLGFNGNTMGAFTKYVTIFFNNNLTKQVSFKGETFSAPEASIPNNSAAQKLKPNSSK